MTTGERLRDEIWATIIGRTEELVRIVARCMNTAIHGPSPRATVEEVVRWTLVLNRGLTRFLADLAGKVMADMREYVPDYLLG